VSVFELCAFSIPTTLQKHQLVVHTHEKQMPQPQQYKSLVRERGKEAPTLKGEEKGSSNPKGRREKREALRFYSLPLSKTK
jgi:hypothetical protein